MPDTETKDMTDEQLRAAIEACDFDCLEYDELMVEAEKRDLDL